MRIAGTTVAITGAGSGIGRALALAAASRGARIAGLDWNAESMEETAALVRKAGGACLAHCGDVTQPGSAEGFAQAVVAEYGAVDILVNNAGIIQTSGAPASPRRRARLRWSGGAPGAAVAALEVADEHVIGRAVEVGARLGKGVLADHVTEQPTGDVVEGRMDAAVDPREPRLIGGVEVLRPLESDFDAWATLERQVRVLGCDELTQAVGKELRPREQRQHLC